MFRNKSTSVFYRKTHDFILILCIILPILLFSTSCNLTPDTRSGNYTVTGIVALADGTPLQGATVSMQGTSNSATTDANGAYTLKKIPGRTVVLQAEKEGKILIPEFSGISDYSGFSINVTESSEKGKVTSANFIAADELTISLIQGKGHISPLTGSKVTDIVGVVTYVEKARAHYKFDSSTYEGKKLIDQAVGEDGFYMQMTTPDGDPLTSDGIFVSTRNPEVSDKSKSAWLSSCMPNGNYPKPGDIVKVSGVVEEFRPVDRFNEAIGNLTRTQITASSVVATGETQNIGNGVLLTYTAPVSASDQDSYRVLEFNSTGLDALAKSSMVFESVEGMLVRVENPIVTGGTYYNFTGIMADGGKKDGMYPEPFNKTWLAPVVRANDFNAEQIHVWWDNKYYDHGNDKDAPSLAKIPQLGTVLAQDGYTVHDPATPPYITGVMDYVADGNYIIYPFRNQEMSSNVTFDPHDEYNFVINKDSFYATNQDPAGNMLPSPIEYSVEQLPLIDSKQADHYQPWIYGTGDPKKNPGAYPIQTGTYNSMFTVPWDLEPLNSTNPVMSIGIFNMENYIDEGYMFIYGYPRKRNPKQDNVARAIVKAMKCPDIIFVVEMGDDDNNGDDIHYNNQDHNWLAPTGIVSARKNYVGLIDTIEEFSGIKYDYRQIDPIEFDQAGAVGNNIRVGFLFRTDRIKAQDSGLVTHHIGSMPSNLIDKPEKEEPALTRLAKAHAAPYIKGEGDSKELTLTQSPGFIQNSAFYHSRIPLISKFTFLPGNEHEQTFFGIAAHLYAKGPDAPLYGDQQPPVFISEIRRGNQAIALNAYLRELQALDPDAKIIVAGDMNDFAFSPAVRKLTGEFSGNQILYSLTEEFMPEEERFTYYFRGNLQQLDHIFVSKNLFDKAEAMGGSWETKVFIPHIDSPFSRNNHIQISDHDPVVALIDMSK